MQSPSAEQNKLQRARLLRLLLLAAGGIALLYVLGRSCGPTPQAGSSDPGSPREGASDAKVGRGAEAGGFDDVSIGQEYRTSVASQGHRVRSLEDEAAALRRELGALRAELEKAAAAQESQGSRLAELARSPGASGSQDLKAPEAGALLPGLAPAPPLPAPQGGIRVLQFGAPEAAGGPKKSLRLPSASAGEALLLNGVFAPVSGEASPLRLRLEAALLGPSRSRVPLREAILIGKAVGDANATRVGVELVSLSYVKPDGLSIELPVRGYVVGADGMEGIPGRYLYRLEEQLPLSMVAEGVAGFTSALAERETTRSVTPFGGATSVVTGDPLKYAGLKAASGSSAKVGEILAERMRELRPAVWTPAEQRVHVVFLEGVTLEGIEAQEANDDEVHPFGELDLDR